MPEFAGNVTFNEQPSELRFRSGVGWSNVRTWVGAPQHLNAFLLTVPGLFSSLSIRKTPVSATVEAEYAVQGGDGDGSNQAVDPISTVWTMPNNDEEVSILAMDEVVDMFQQLGEPSASTLAVDIIRAVEDRTQPDKFDWTAYVLTDTQRELAQNVYSRLLRGIQSITVSRYVLSKVQTVTSASQIKAAHENVNKVYSYPQLVSAEPTLPSAPLIDAGGLQDQLWLKRTPKIDQVSRGQFQILQEYWGAKYPDPFTHPRVK